MPIGPGPGAAQSYRDSKNPYDSAISGCYSIYYWMMDRFHNQGKAGLGLSAMINGTGFMVAASTLKKLGGWRTETISEDLEMTAQCVLADVQVAWVPLAVTYDEQPLTYRESVKQRRRWSSGTHPGGAAVPATDRTPDDSGPPGSASGHRHDDADPGLSAGGGGQYAGRGRGGRPERTALHLRGRGVLRRDPAERGTDGGVRYLERRPWC